MLSFIRGRLTQLNTRFEYLPVADAYTSVGLTADTIAAVLNLGFWEKSAESALLAKRQKKRPKMENLFGGNEAQSS